MKNIIKYFVKYPVLGNSIFAMILLFGIVGYTNLKTTFFPDVPSRNILINAFYPGASPEEIEEGITLKIEDNLKGLTGVDRVTSTSSENSASINVELQSGFDATDLLQEVKNKVDQINSFPVGMEKINVYKLEMIDFVVAFAISGDVDLTILKKTARRIERDLLNMEEVSKVSLGGFPEEEIEVSFRETDLRAFNLTFNEVSNAIASANIKITGGKIKGKEEEFQIRADNKGYYAKDLENLVIKSTSKGFVVRLKDVANVNDRWSEDPNRDYFNGKPAVIVDVSKTNEEDMFEIADVVKEYINNFNESNENVKIDILRDGSAIVKERIDILSSNAMIGIVLVLLFLGLSLNARMSFWVAVSIPISFAGMFMLGVMSGLTINVMSLMAMILVIGILVDDGIVIAENIYQHHERGESPIQAAINGTIEVLPSVTAAILTTIVIFMTFFFLEGDLGDRAGDIAFVVIATLIMSLVEAVFILPAHIAHSKALKQDAGKHGWFESKSEAALHWIRDKLYAPALKFSIDHTMVSIAIPAALFIITLGAINGSIIKTTFFPNIESNNITVSLEMPAGTPANVTDSILTEMEISTWKVNEDYRRDFPDEPDLVTNISRKVGTMTHQGKLRVILVESRYRKLNSQQITSLIRKNIGKIDGAENLQVGGGTRWGMPVSIALKSDNIDQLRQAKDALRSELTQVKKLKDVITNDPPGLQEVKITLKEKAYALGLTYSQVMDYVRSGFYGEEAQRILRGIDEVRIWVRYEEQARSSIDQLENMRIRLTGGREIPLKEIANISIERGVMALYHIDGQRVVRVEADLTSSKESVPDILADIQSSIMPALLKKYPDVDFDFEGQNRQNKKMMDSFALVVPPILILMFIIVVFTFRSFMQSFAVYLMIPFTFVGVAWGHFVQGYIISMLSIFGMIALIGIVVNDSLVLVNTMNRLLKTGMKFKEALYEAGLSRFRPVLLTSLTTIAGLGPLIFETSHQAQFLSPMAISVAYGLLYGTFLTLLMLPSILVFFNNLKVFIYRILGKENITAETVEPAVREEFFAQSY